MTATAAPPLAAHLRRFNRSYTRQLGLLSPGHLDSPWSLTEVRVLFELAHRPEPTATDIAVALNLDMGYLSRLLTRFRRQGLVRAERVGKDRRLRRLGLTEKGARAFHALDAKATASIQAFLGRLAPTEQERLVGAAREMEALLNGVASAASPEASEIRGLERGDLGWVLMRHGEMYREDYGFGTAFEALVAKVIGDYATMPEHPCRQAWVATVGGRRAGTVFLMPGDPPGVARLRLLLVEPWARGHRLGTRLVERCIGAARAAGCTRLTLWTNSELVAARRIYEQAGFTLAESAPSPIFEGLGVGQTWNLDLQPSAPSGRKA